MKGPFFSIVRKIRQSEARGRKLGGGRTRVEGRVPRGYCSESVFAFVIGCHERFTPKNAKRRARGWSAPFAFGEARCISRARNGCVRVIRFVRRGVRGAMEIVRIGLLPMGNFISSPLDRVKFPSRMHREFFTTRLSTKWYGLPDVRKSRFSVHVPSER